MPKITSKVEAEWDIFDFSITRDEDTLHSPFMTRRAFGDTDVVLSTALSDCQQNIKFKFVQIKNQRDGFRNIQCWSSVEIKDGDERLSYSLIEDAELPFELTCSNLLYEATEMTVKVHVKYYRDKDVPSEAETSLLLNFADFSCFNDSLNDTFDDDNNAGKRKTRNKIGLFGRSKTLK